MIVGLIGYDSIRKHLAACGYYTAEIREKYYLRIADAYIDIKEQRSQLKIMLRCFIIGVRCGHLAMNVLMLPQKEKQI